MSPVIYILGVVLLVWLILRFAGVVVGSIFWGGGLGLVLLIVLLFVLLR